MENPKILPAQQHASPSSPTAPPALDSLISASAEISLAGLLLSSSPPADDASTRSPSSSSSNEATLLRSQDPFIHLKIPPVSPFHPQTPIFLLKTIDLKTASAAAAALPNLCHSKLSSREKGTHTMHTSKKDSSFTRVSNCRTREKTETLSVPSASVSPRLLMLFTVESTDTIESPSMEEGLFSDVPM